MQTKVSGLIILLTVSISTAQAECPRWEKLNQSGQKAIDDGNYKRAEVIWIKAAKEAQNCSQAEPTALGTSLKRLGEVYLKNAKYPLADTSLKQATEEIKKTGKEDQELT